MTCQQKAESIPQVGRPLLMGGVSLSVSHEDRAQHGDGSHTQRFPCCGSFPCTGLRTKMAEVRNADVCSPLACLQSPSPQCCTHFSATRRVWARPRETRSLRLKAQKYQPGPSRASACEKLCAPGVWCPGNGLGGRRGPRVSTGTMLFSREADGQREQLN